MTRELQAAVGASVSNHFDALRLRECSPATDGARAHALPAATVVALLALHLAGLAALWRYYQQPAALTIPTLLLANAAWAFARYASGCVTDGLKCVKTS